MLFYTLAFLEVERPVFHRCNEHNKGTKTPTSKQDQQENVTFNFAQQGFTNAASSGVEQTMSSAQHSGMELGSFLSRPVKISEIEWNDGDTLSISELNPWDLYLSNPTVARKIANYKLFKGRMHIKLVINGSPFLYGKLMSYYNPLHTMDNFIPENTPSRLCRLSQRQHIYIDPTTSAGGELILPFFWPYNAVNIPEKDWQRLGILKFLPISNLKHASGEIPRCDISVYAWIDNVELTQSTEMTTYEMQAEESKKVVSKTAMAVGTIAEVMSDVPIIGPYATATEYVAKGLGRFADLFGFSKPRGTHDLGFVRTTKMGSLATTNDKDMAVPLTLCVKNQTTVDPRTVGLSPRDEMSIPEIVSKECLITRFKWKTTDRPDTELLRIPITPYIKASFPSDNKIDLPPAAYMATFFKYWKGSLRYRFMMNACNFHRGKLRFRYEPYKTNGGNDYNVVQSEIVDLSTTHDYSFDVGWGADRNYLEVMGPSGQPFGVNTEPVGLNHNGCIVVTVANSLQVPDETTSDEIEVVVGFAGDRDLQFSVPSAENMQRVELLQDSGTDVIPDPDPPTGNIYPQAYKPSDTIKMGVYYYGWHEPNFNNNEGYVRRELSTSEGAAQGSAAQLPWVIGRSTSGEEYNDRQRDVTAKQFTVMLNSGIDYVCCSWWGAESRTDNQFEVAVMTECGDVPGRGWMRACIHYESERLKTGGQWLLNTNFYNTISTDMAKIKTYTAQTDKYLFVDNKPVIFFYLFRSMPDDFKRELIRVVNGSFDASNVGPGAQTRPYIVGDFIFGSSRALPQDIQDDMGAIAAYDVYGQTVGNSNYATEADVMEYHSRLNDYRFANPGCDLVTTISPGYNDRAVRREANHIALSRALDGYDEGSLLKAHLQATTLRSWPSTGTSLMIVNSWNEWHEETTLEPVATVGAVPSSTPADITQGLTYYPYGTEYVNIIGDYMVPSYTAQSGDAGKDEDTMEHSPDMNVSMTLMEKQSTYHHDDSIFFGERIGSVRSMIKRYTLYLKRNSSGSGLNKLHFPQMPYYELERKDVTDGTFTESLICRLAVLYLGRRGATRWKAINDFHNTTPRAAVVKLEPEADLALTTNVSSSQTFADGWNGMTAVTGVYEPVLEWEVPYYSNARFQISRSVKRDGDIGHSHVFDSASIYRNYYLTAAGDDFQLFYFSGTPSVTIS